MTQNTTHACPRDKSALAWREDAGLASYQCGTCAGLFVEQATLAGAGHTPLNLPSGTPRVLGQLPKGDVACASCAEPMLRLMHKGVEIDICRFCRAFWLDGGEWERIAKPGSGARRAAVIAGAAAGGAALGAAASQGGVAQQAAQADGGGFVADLAGTVASEAGGAVIEVVFEFIGEAIGSLF